VTTEEIINLINKIILRKERNSIEQGRIIKCNPDNTYNVLITGSSGQLYKISPINDSSTSYSVGDNVLVGYAFESSAIPNILGKSSIEIPEEEEVVVKEKLSVSYVYCAIAESIAGCVIYSGSSNEWTEGSSFQSSEIDYCYNICKDDTYIYMVETYDCNIIRRYSSSGEFVGEHKIEV